MGPMDIAAIEATKIKAKDVGCSGYWEPCKTTDDCCGKEPDAGGLSFKCSSGVCMGPMDIITEEKKATGCSGYFEPCKTTDDCCGKEPDACGLSYKCSSGMCMGPMVFNDVCAKQDEPCTSVADCCNTMSSKCKKNGK